VSDGADNWTGERDRARRAIADIRERGMAGADLVCRALGSILDLVNHSHVHHECAIAALVGSQLQVQADLDGSGVTVQPATPARAGTLEELELLRELAGVVLDWLEVDQADAAGRRPHEDDLARLAMRWRQEAQP
jgi:hypothetical protein